MVAVGHQIDETMIDPAVASSGHLPIRVNRREFLVAAGLAAILSSGLAGCTPRQLTAGPSGTERPNLAGVPDGIGDLEGGDFVEFRSTRTRAMMGQFLVTADGARPERISMNNPHQMHG